MVSLVDIVPTLLELQGLEIPREMQGAPLPTITDSAPRDAVFSEYGAGGPAFTMRDLEAMPIRHGLEASRASLQWREAEGRRKMVRTRHWKHVTDPLGDLDELYDLASDPNELHNLASEPTHADIVAELRSRLLAWAIRTEDALPVPLPAIPKERIPLSS
jgi:arylsulfatase A-like enzyme